ncbi:MAG: hypothetical protein H6834_17785 [Planctomycetes bacterium]|nr:hypothetical protein [Planctomycetota bacterium]
MHLAPLAIAVCLLVSAQDPPPTQTVDVHEALHDIAKACNANVMIAPDVTGNVTRPAADVPWRVAIHQVAHQAGSTVEEWNGVLRITKTKKAPTGPRVMFDFVRADVRKVVATIAKLAGTNIVVDASIEGTITLRLRNIAWRDALEIIASTSGWVVTEGEDGVVRLTAR